MTLVVIVYEAYLAVTLVSFEPLLFFTGLVAYWGLLYHSLFNMPMKELPRQVVQTLRPPQEQEQEEEEEEEDNHALYTDMNVADEEAMMKDETIMSEWRDLLTRAWKTNDEGPTSSAASIFAADNDISSVMSRSSRFDEEENFTPSVDSISSSSDDDEDEDLGFDPDTLEAYLSQYDQIKKDAQLAKKLQIEEQKARDENNPFVVEDMAVGTKPPLKIDSDVADYDEDQVTTPTDKEAWKIRVFRD